MPATKTPRLMSSADLDAAIEQVAPDVLALRSRRMTGAEALHQPCP
jgi:hypothetical protein